MKRTRHWYLNLDLKMATWDELLKLVITSTIWFWSMITTLLLTRSGFTSKFQMFANSQPTSSILSTWLNQRARTTKAWSLCSTQAKKQSLTMATELDGIATGKTSCISKMHSRKKEVAFITLSPSQFSLCTTMMKSTWPTAILILTPIAQNYWWGCACQSPRTAYARL